MTQLFDPAEITNAIRSNLEGFTPDLTESQVGRVTEVGDGIARIAGLPNCPVNALLEFESGVRGLALNLDEDSIGAVILGGADEVAEGDAVRASGEILSVPVGDGMLGRVVNALLALPDELLIEDVATDTEYAEHKAEAGCDSADPAAKRDRFLGPAPPDEPPEPGES